MPTALLTDDSLFQDILRAPQDDALRLQYAEWLSRSTNSSDQARGEFIRLQIDLARFSEDNRRWPLLVGRQRELLTAHRTVWERPLRNRCRPKLNAPTKWLKAQLFGSGGVWGFSRGFIESILAAADRYLVEDSAIMDLTPIRRVALTHASEFVELLANESRLNQLDSLHLIGDVELDEELQFLANNAQNAGLRVLEYRFPNLRDLFVDSIPSDSGPIDSSVDEISSKWRKLPADPKARLKKLLQTPSQRMLLDEPAPEHTAAVLALSDWVFVGNLFHIHGVWAVAKGYHDSPDEEGRCRRLVLLREEPAEALLKSPYFHAEIR